LRDVIERRHRIHVKKRRLSLCKFDAGDSQRPHVHLCCVEARLHGQDDLGGDPARCAHERVGGVGQGRGTKIPQLNLALSRDENVGSLDIPAEGEGNKTGG